MLFNSGTFMIFFPAAAIIYFVVPKKARYIWLLLVSYYFYMSWNIKFSVLLAVSTVFTYILGRTVGALNSGEGKFSKIKRIDHIKKGVLLIGLIVNIALIIYFKYTNFLLYSLNMALSIFNVDAVVQVKDILLPLGISFYTFKVISYIVDVYRGDTAAEKNILKYALYVSFFPQIMSGPIERSKSFLKQVNELPKAKLWNFRRITDGALVMLYGYFLKMVISDRLSILAAEVLDRWYLYGTFELLLGALFFSLQIYCDFSGYSLIAIGAGEVLGFSTAENFNAPYFALSVRDFWRRWHISLSTWFRDYLYIPLGGSRCSKTRKYFNLMTTFLVSGLWHGAAWGYVVWGGLHGLYQIIGDVTAPLKAKIYRIASVKTDCFSFRAAKTALTFVCTMFAWIFFRQESVSESVKIIGRIFSRFNPWVLFNGALYELGLNAFEMHVLFAALLVLFLVDRIKYQKGLRLDEVLGRQNIWFKGMVAAVLIFWIFVYGIYGPGYDAAQFIYSDF